MVRADRNYPDVYFGRPGSLIKLPYPRGGMDKSYERQISDFITGSGQHRVSSLLSGARLYSLIWNGLHMDNYARIEQYWTGMMGRGPWVFIDPSMPNLLLPNQSSSTSMRADAEHWVPDNGVVLSNGMASQIHRPGQPRSLRWFWSGSASVIPKMSLVYPYRAWHGFPVVPGLSYAFSSWMKPDGIVDSSIECGIRLAWVDVAGNVLYEDSGGNHTTTAWQRHTVVGVAPPTAAYVRPHWIVTGSTVSAGGSLYIDESLLEQDTVVNDWSPGTGLRAVEMLDLTDSPVFNARFRADISAVLRELAS